jgi:hypothetical protein
MTVAATAPAAVRDEAERAAARVLRVTAATPDAHEPPSLVVVGPVPLEAVPR